MQRLAPPARRQEHNDVAGFIYAVLGVVYAVLLGLVVVAVWEEYEMARDTTDREANELAGIFFLANGFPEPERNQLQDLARSYARAVVNEEWSLMEQGSADPRAWELLDALRGRIQESEPDTEAEQVFFDQGLERFHRLAEARRMRLLEIDEGIPAILWAALIVGGIVVVSFTYLFGLENTRAHILMVMALAGIIALVLFTIGTLEYPFAGGARISPDTFEQTLERLETSRLSDLE